MVKYFIGAITVLFSVILFFLLKFMYMKSYCDNLTVDFQIVPFDYINLIFSSLFTFFIAWYIARKLSADRYEKEFLIEDLKSTLIELERFSKNVSEYSEQDLQSIVLKLNQIKFLFQKFETTLRLTKLSTPLVKEFNTAFFELYTHSTSTDNDKLLLTVPVKIELNLLISKLIELTRNLILYINKQ